MRVIISGGGTGGHLYPALAVGQKFKARGDDVLYIGSTHGLEASVLPNLDFQYRLLDVEGLRGKNPLALAKSSLLLLKADQAADKLVKEFQPQLVIGTGGYASFPVLHAGVHCGAKTIIHEANAEMGKANLQLAPKVDCICLTYKETARDLQNAKRILITGMIMRECIADATRAQGGAYLKVDEDKLVVVITGGSQGSRHINDAMVAYYQLAPVRNDVLFYHIVGKLNEDEAKILGAFPNVRTTLYEEHMDKVLARADLCVGRAGASFLAEIACRGLPTVLVPYPFSHGHQEKNANAFARKGAALCVLDNELPDGLHTALSKLINDAELRQTMGDKMRLEARPDALGRIVELGVSLVENGR